MAQNRESRRVPFQLVVMIAFVGIMMLIVWFKLAAPDFKDSVKAQQTAQFYLEALGKAPIDKLGAELHPEVRRAFTPETLKARLAALGLEQPVTVLQWREEVSSKQPPQFSWRVDIRTPKAGRVPLLMSVRLPTEQTIGRRWRVYALCRPDLDLLPLTRAVLKNPAKLAGWPRLAAFKPEPESQWKLVSTAPPTLVVPGRDSRERLSTSWQVAPDGQLGCHYQSKETRLVSAVDKQ